MLLPAAAGIWYVGGASERGGSGVFDIPTLLFSTYPTQAQICLIATHLTGQDPM